MATGIEMLVSTLVKALKLEPEVEKIRAYINNGALDGIVKFSKDAGEMNERLRRIERKLGIIPGSGSELFDARTSDDVGTVTPHSNGTGH